MNALQFAQILMQGYVFFVGACVGSFANVCIHRLPTGKSIVGPRSMCPQCGRPIRWYDNIPLLSYLWLRGRCRRCNAPISLRYPVVEAMHGLMALGIYLKFGLSWAALVYFAFITVLIIITFIDLDHFIIPNVLSIPGIPVFWLASLLMPYSVLWPHPLHSDPLSRYLLHSLGLEPDLLLLKLLHGGLGLLIGGGTLYGVAAGYMKLRKIEGMGGGDIKLLAMIGVVVGWSGVLVTLLVASAAGTLAGVLVMAHQRSFSLKLRVPFGPFLAIGAISYIFWGCNLWNGLVGYAGI